VVGCFEREVVGAPAPEPVGATASIDARLNDLWS
jgi:hypothetical protein